MYFPPSIEATYECETYNLAENIETKLVAILPIQCSDDMHANW